MSTSEITQEQRIEIFAQKIVEGLSQSDAYRAAYPKTRAKPETIHVKASVFASDDKVKARIEELKQAALESHEITAAKVISQLVCFGYYDIRLLHGEDGTLLKPHELPDEIIQAVTGVEYHTNGELKKYTMVSKDKAIEMLGRYFNLFKDRGIDDPFGAEDGTDLDVIDTAKRFLYTMALAEHEKSTRH